MNEPVLSGPLEIMGFKDSLHASIMGGEAAHISREMAFLKGCFRDYYAANNIEPPYRFPKREWGFFPFGGKMMFRHIAFIKTRDMLRFFAENVPMHAYYSTAYYGDPGAQPMGDKFKTWMGADLIFDLDADHIPGAEDMSYPEQMGEVKRELGKLLFDFILDDLGFSRENTHLYFSGGRGYHIHVRDPDVLKLNSRDRRQIVDYITGRGMDYNILFPEKVVSVNTRFGSVKKRRDFRKREWGGWVKKIYAGKDNLIRELSEFERKKEQIRYLVDLSKVNKLEIKQKKCESII